MFDVDKFLGCVRERPALWKKQTKEYCDKNCREKSWIEIGEIMNENWSEFEMTRRDEKVREMKNKWRHIRDNFLKFLNQIKNGNAAHKKTKYVYADSLAFLLNSMERQKNSCHIVESTTKTGCMKKEIREETDGKQRSAMSLHSGESDAGVPRSKVRRAVRRRCGTNSFTLFQSELLKKMENCSRRKDEDPDKSYLVSLLPDYKRLNNDEKLDFRLLTLQFFHAIRDRRKNTSIESSSNSSHPSAQMFSFNPTNKFENDVFPIMPTLSLIQAPSSGQTSTPRTLSPVQSGMSISHSEPVAPGDFPCSIVR